MTNELLYLRRKVLRHQKKLSRIRTEQAEREYYKEMRAVYQTEKAKIKHINNQITSAADFFGKTKFIRIQLILYHTAKIVSLFSHLFISCIKGNI